MGLFANIGLAVLFMAVLGVALAGLLAFANRKLHVHEDPRIDDVEEMLPHANCGACGYPEHSPFAEAAVSGEAPPSQCSVNSPEGTQAIADFLGVEAGSSDRVVARLACAGGNHVARIRAQYTGLDTCRAAAVAGGGKACSWGCLGLADCEASCDFDAIHMDEHGLPVVDVDKCVGCNDCVLACPKNLFSLEPVSRQLWVACKSLAEGDEAQADCEVACTACGRCAQDAPEGVIEIKDNLACINYDKNHLCTKLATERCPTGSIVWLEGSDAIKGSAAKKIIRRTALPVR